MAHKKAEYPFWKGKITEAQYKEAVNDLMKIINSLEPIPHPTMVLLSPRAYRLMKIAWIMSPYQPLGRLA